MHIYFFGKKSHAYLKRWYLISDKIIQIILIGTILLSRIVYFYSMSMGHRFDFLFDLVLMTINLPFSLEDVSIVRQNET
jgi:hypothetical protein